MQGPLFEDNGFTRRQFATVFVTSTMARVLFVAQACCIECMIATALRTEMVRARIEPRQKHRCDAVLEKIGIAPSQAINMPYAQIVRLKAMPFDLRIPTKKTAARL